MDKKKPQKGQAGSLGEQGGSCWFPPGMEGGSAHPPAPGMFGMGAMAAEEPWG